MLRNKQKEEAPETLFYICMRAKSNSFQPDNDEISIAKWFPLYLFKNDKHEYSETGKVRMNVDGRDEIFSHDVFFAVRNYMSKKFFLMDNYKFFK
jgi:hypothetical protein